MRIRPYIESRDYEYLEKWSGDARTHALWCANLFPYPLTREGMHNVLERTPGRGRGARMWRLRIMENRLAFSATLSMRKAMWDF